MAQHRTGEGKGENRGADGNSQGGHGNRADNNRAAEPMGSGRAFAPPYRLRPHRVTTSQATFHQNTCVWTENREKMLMLMIMLIIITMKTQSTRKASCWKLTSSKKGVYFLGPRHLPQ